MISTRYAPHVIVLLLVALVPTVIHVYAGLERDDGRRVGQIEEQLAGMESRPTDRRKAWGEAVFDSHDWFERLYEQDGKKVRLFVGRSFNQKRLYHHPEIALSRGVELSRPRIVHLPDQPEIPVHLMTEVNGNGIAAYVLLYRNGFVSDPVAAQLADALWQLFNPREQMTLFYVAQSNVPPDRGFEGSAAAAVLLEALKSFADQKPSPEEI
ncbi:MAG TPA: hypothetical protein EYP90_01970 [Chromatiaceae bacterium]|nr:hypothetical protein [Chromatiaceae bacterium]